MPAPSSMAPLGAPVAFSLPNELTVHLDGSAPGAPAELQRVVHISLAPPTPGHLRMPEDIRKTGGKLWAMLAREKLVRNKVPNTKTYLRVVDDQTVLLFKGPTVPRLPEAPSEVDDSDIEVVAERLVGAARALPW